MINYEEYATHNHVKDGTCPESPFSSGAHRVGLVPMYSLLDGGASGDICHEVCLECGKHFPSQSFFVIKKQPNRIGGRYED